MTACKYMPQTNSHLPAPCATPATWVAWPSDIIPPVPAQCLEPLCQTHAAMVAGRSNRTVCLLDEVGV